MEEAKLTDPFIKGWLDYLAFALSGLDAAGTLGAAVAFTMGDLYRPGASLDYPVGGSGAVIDALVRGIERHGGTVRLSTHVERINVDESGRAVGVTLRSGEVLPASAVVSNADAWATVKLLPETARPVPRPRQGGALNSGMAKTDSFMHLHIGFRAAEGELQAMKACGMGLGIHYSVVLDDFEDICKDNNMVIISIPTLLDPGLAPEGHHVLHAYYAADEPYTPWAGLDRRSEEYAALKLERAKPLWAAVEKLIPDIKERLVVEMVGTPLTHERFLRRTEGTYGPPLFAPGGGGETIPYAGTPVPGLLRGSMSRASPIQPAWPARPDWSAEAGRSLGQPEA